MTYYEIKNYKTGRQFTAMADGMRKACEMNGEKVRDCKCVYSTKIFEKN